MIHLLVKSHLFRKKRPLWLKLWVVTNLLRVWCIVPDHLSGVTPGLFIGRCWWSVYSLSRKLYGGVVRRKLKLPWSLTLVHRLRPVGRLNTSLLWLLTISKYGDLNPTIHYIVVYWCYLYCKGTNLNVNETRKLGKWNNSDTEKRGNLNTTFYDWVQLTVKISFTWILSINPWFPLLSHLGKNKVVFFYSEPLTSLNSTYLLSPLLTLPSSQLMSQLK